MTMVPPQNISKIQHILYGGGGGYGVYDGVNYSETSFSHLSPSEGYDCYSEACLIGSESDLVTVAHMAEDESRTNSLNEAGSSSKDANKDQDKDEGSWLQLSIGDGHQNTRASTSHDPREGRQGLIELDLLPGTSSQSQQQMMTAPIFHVPEFRAPRPMMTNNNSSASLFLQHSGITSSSFPHQEINWALRPILPQNMIVASSSSTSSLMPMMGSYFARPYQLQGAGVDIAGPSSDIRVIDAPRRPLSGIWFMLQASQNQTKEPFLPQIPKSYLRIKDGRMTVRLLIKYLVNKLRLHSESEVEITCRGQQLVPFLTLKHVRDDIWSSRDAVNLLSDSSTTDHIMVLHYGRSA